MEEVINGILIREVETKNIMTKSSLPVGGYSVNPYVGCTHACKYCYASFMKRFTGHKEEWGTFLDVKHWPEIKNPKKYAGQRVVIGSVTDGYNPQEEQFGNTRKLLEQLIGSDADILICTKSDLVVRDIDLLKKLGRVTVSWSINTLDENFKNDMDSASSIEHRIAAMKQVYEAGIRTVCFVSPVFPGITDFEAIFERVKDQCDLFWLENLNLRGGFKKTIMDYIAGKYPDLVPLYDEIYNKHNRSYFEALEVKAEKMAKKYDCAFVDNEMPYGRVPQGHPVIVDYFYHEEIRGTENTGKRNLETGRMALNSLIGVELHAPTEIEDTISAVRADKDLWGEGEIDRPELKMAYARIKIAESSKKLTDAKYKPQFYIGVDGSYSAPGYDFRSDLDPNYAIYAKVSVPLFEWGKRRDEKRASSFKVGMATDYLNQVTDQVKLEVETARVSLSQTMEQVRLTEGSLSKAFENERMALERYTEGKASVIEVIEAQTYRQASQLNHVQAKVSAQGAYSELIRALNKY